MKKGLTPKERRALRNRSKLKRMALTGRARLSVFRSARHIYAQVIDDAKGHTVAAASTLETGFDGKNGGNIDAAAEVGKLIADRAKQAGVSQVVFDRGGHIYHGRIKALADSARESGLEF